MSGCCPRFIEEPVLAVFGETFFGCLDSALIQVMLQKLTHDLVAVVQVPYRRRDLVRSTGGDPSLMDDPVTQTFNPAARRSHSTRK
jgi:hypothetical protein